MAHDLRGHQGREATRRWLKENFHWSTMYQDIIRYTKECLTCQQRKDTVNTPYPLGTISSKHFNDIVAADIMSGVFPTPDGHTSILVMSDYFTRLKVAVALKNKTASEVLDAMKSAWFNVYGHPKRLLTDRGTEFLDGETLSYLKQNGTEKVNTTPYHPQTDGSVERFNRTLQQMLATTCPSQDAWNTKLKEVCDAYNSTPNISTGYSPLWLAGLGSQEDTGSKVFGGGIFASKKDEQTALKQASSHVAQANLQKEKAAVENAKKILNGKYAVGSWVLVRPPKLKSTPFGKLERPWTGPWKILQRKSLWTLLVQEGAHGLSKIINIANAKPYFGPKPVSQSVPQVAKGTTATTTKACEVSRWYPRAVPRQTVPMPILSQPDQVQTTSIENAEESVNESQGLSDVIQLQTAMAEEISEEQNAESSETTTVQEVSVERVIQEQVVQDVPEASNLRRSTRSRKAPVRYGDEE